MDLRKVHGVRVGCDIRGGGKSLQTVTVKTLPSSVMVFVSQEYMNMHVTYCAQIIFVFHENKRLGG